jgi:hypothetical protein
MKFCQVWNDEIGEMKSHPPDWRATNPLSGFRMCVRRIRLLEASKPDWRNHKKILLIENIQYIHHKKT